MPDSVDYWYLYIYKASALRATPDGSRTNTHITLAGTLTDTVTGFIYI